MNYRYKEYDIITTERLNSLELELLCFNQRWQKGPGPHEHFKRAAKQLWGEKSNKQFAWHPWAEEITEQACKWDRLGVSGCASSGKSDWGAVWALISWLSDPLNTLVLVTSRTLGESHMRIWGKIVSYWQPIAKSFPFGKLVDSEGLLRTVHDGDTIKDSGIKLIPAEKKKEKEAVGKLIGIKCKKVVLIIDEMPEISPAVLGAANSNLVSNPYFQAIGLGNFASIFDSFGDFVAPVMGYESININTHIWPIKAGVQNVDADDPPGVCIHLDGEKSPNLDHDEDIWPIYGHKQFERHQRLGPETALYWRMCRSFLTTAGLDYHIYSDADFLRGNAFKPAVWMSDYVKISALDPSFTAGGDKSIQYFGNWGLTTDGIWTLEFAGWVQLMENVSILDKPFDLQIAEQFRDNCKERGIKPEHAGLDTTGAGLPFKTLLGQLWSDSTVGVHFGGSASDMAIVVDSEDVGKDRYANRVSEIWYVGREFLLAGQFKGFDKETAVEMTGRRYITKKELNTKILAEPKVDMKARTGVSPDKADAAMILVDMVRSIFGAVAGGVVDQKPRRDTNWRKHAIEHSEIYA